MATFEVAGGRVGPVSGDEGLNAADGPVRFLLPEGGVSLLDAPGEPFHDPEADNALIEAIERTVRPTTRRHIERVGGNINEPPFADAVAAAWQDVAPKQRRSA